MEDSKLLAKIRNEYTEARDFYYSRKLRQVQQLRLLNNLRRGDENIASTMLFSFFNRVMSNLYEDKIQIKFVPTEEMDNKKVETINKLAVNDFREMDMSMHEYDWIWDALFFGKGFIETLKFDKRRKIMKPVVINPLVFGSDPFFSDPQDWRYYWKWILKSGHELKNMIDSGLIDGITNIREIPTGMEADLWNFKVQRDQAKVLTSTSDNSIATEPIGDIFQILEIYTIDDEGNKICAWVDKSFSKILMKEPIELGDGEHGSSKWPIVVKELFREPHSSVSFSIPDLIEDKHRADSVLMNLAFIAAKDEANPLYQYDPNKVKDITQLFQRQISQHIPVDDVATSIAPVNKNSALTASLLQFLTLIRAEATDPIGTGVNFQPIQKGKQTATQAALQQQLNDLAQSLQTKVLQIGEKEFWSHWYQRYIRNTKEGDEKIISITSVKGVSFENIDLGDIKTNNPPRIEVFSAKEAEYKELVEKRDMMQIYPQFANTLDPEGMKNFNKYIFLPKFVKDSSSIDLIIPKTMDEIQAEDENIMLDVDKMQDVKETDDDATHLYVHASAKNTPSTIAHRIWHQEMLAFKKKEEQKQKQMGQITNPPGSQPQPGQPPAPNIPPNQKKPEEAAVPLKEGTKQKVAVKT